MNEQTATTQSNLTLKIASIMAEMPEIEKQRVSFNTSKGKVNYSAYGIDQITGQLRKRMGDAKIAIYPEVIGSIDIASKPFLQMQYTLKDGDSDDNMICQWLQPLSFGGDIAKDMGAAISYATKNFLMRTFMISPEGDPDIDTNPVTDDEPRQSSNGNKPQAKPKPEPLIKEPKAKELDGTVQNLISLTRTNAAKFQNTYVGKIDYDEVPGLKVLLFDEHLQEMDMLTGKPEGTTKEIMDNLADNQVVTIDPPLAIKLVYYPEGEKYKLKMAPRNQHPIGFDNPQILHKFMQDVEGIDEHLLLEALGVDRLQDYDKGIYTARAALQEYLTDYEPPLTDVMPANVTKLGENGYVRAKQKSLANMPGVVSDLAATKGD